MAETNNMATDNELQTLEQRVNELINTCDQLKADNRTLRDRQESLVQERATLIEKSEEAKRRVEGMIARLRNLEVSS